MIAEKHTSSFSGLNELHAILIAMRYISGHDIVQPPHSAEAISDDTFQNFGYEPETIGTDKAGASPAYRSGTGLEPEWHRDFNAIKAVNYFINHY